MSTTTNSALISYYDSRTHFYEKVQKHIKSLNYKYQEKTVITEEMKTKIFRCLSNKYPDEFNSRFKSWCRTSFSIRKIGVESVLCDSKNRKPILIYEQMYEIFKQIHEETAHGGRDKCMNSLSVNYSWYNRQLMQIFINNCQACQNRQAVKIPMLSKPIIELGKT
jgi:hypothetical protein